jgi:hypothetical protein
LVLPGTGAFASSVAALAATGGLFPYGLTGLVAWYEASSLVTTSGGLVTAWGDSSGNGHDASSPSGHRPVVATGINGLPSIQFDGSTTYLTTALAIAAEPYSIYVVAQVGTQAARSLVSDTSGGLWTLGCQSATTVWVYAGSQDIIQSDTLSGPAIFRGIYNGSSSSVRTSPGNVLGTGTLGAQAIAGMGIGADVAGPQWYWDKWISEILIFSGTVSAGNDSALMSYLGTKYNISQP